MTNVTLGIWLFLASEVMLFGCAVFRRTRLLRASARQSWPSGRDVLSLALACHEHVVLMLMTRLASGGRGRRRPPTARRLLVVVRAGGGVPGGQERRIRRSRSAGSRSVGQHVPGDVLHADGTARAPRHRRSRRECVGAGGRPPGRHGMTTGRIRALALYWAFVDAVWVVHLHPLLSVMTIVTIRLIATLSDLRRPLGDQRVQRVRCVSGSKRAGHRRRATAAVLVLIGVTACVLTGFGVFIARLHPPRSSGRAGRSPIACRDPFLPPRRAMPPPSTAS